MDQKALEEKIKEYFLKLTPELQEVVGNGKWVDSVAEIGKNNALNIPQIGQLQNEVMLVMLGIVHPDKFLWDIKDSLNLPTTKIEKLIKETSDAVFLPVRQQLMGVYVKNTADEETSVAENAIFDKAGISIENESSTSTPTKPSEARADLLKGIENPVKSIPTVLNETKPQAPLSSIATTSAVREMAVPVAPYAKPETPKTVSVPATNIMADKLGGSFAVPKKDTDYSMKNLGGTTPASTPMSGDSYREPIE